MAAAAKSCGSLHRGRHQEFAILRGGRLEFLGSVEIRSQVGRVSKNAARISYRPCVNLTST